jgi:hypothetical protein
MQGYGNQDYSMSEAPQQQSLQSNPPQNSFKNSSNSVPTSSKKTVNSDAFDGWGFDGDDNIANSHRKNESESKTPAPVATRSQAANQQKPRPKEESKTAVSSKKNEELDPFDEDWGWK